MRTDEERRAERDREYGDAVYDAWRRGLNSDAITREDVEDYGASGAVNRLARAREERREAAMEEQYEEEQAERYYRDQAERASVETESGRAAKEGGRDAH